MSQQFCPRLQEPGDELAHLLSRSPAPLINSVVLHVALLSDVLVQHSRHDGLLHVLEVTVRGGCGLVQGLVGKQQAFPAGVADVPQNLDTRKGSSRE